MTSEEADQLFAALAREREGRLSAMTPEERQAAVWEEEGLGRSTPLRIGPTLDGAERPLPRDRVVVESARLRREVGRTSVLDVYCRSKLLAVVMRIGPAWHTLYMITNEVTSDPRGASDWRLEGGGRAMLPCDCETLHVVELDKILCRVPVHPSSRKPRRTQVRSVEVAPPA